MVHVPSHIQVLAAASAVGCWGITLYFLRLKLRKPSPIPAPDPVCPQFLCTVLPEDDLGIHCALANTFAEIERFDIRPGTLLLPFLMWDSFSIKTNPTVHGQNHPDAVGVFWGAEVFLYPGVTRVAMIPPRPDDLALAAHP